jgi:hypothetical protein
VGGETLQGKLPSKVLSGTPVGLDRHASGRRLASPGSSDLSCKINSGVQLMRQNRDNLAWPVSFIRIHVSALPGLAPIERIDLG